MNDDERNVRRATAPPGTTETHGYFTLRTVQVMGDPDLLASVDLVTDEIEQALAHVLGCRICLADVARLVSTEEWRIRADEKTERASDACLVARPLVERYVRERIQSDELNDLLASHYESCPLCAANLQYAQESYDLESLAQRSPLEADAVWLSLALSDAALSEHASARMLLIEWLGSGRMGVSEVAAAAQGIDHKLAREAAERILRRRHKSSDEEMGDARRSALAYLLRRQATLDALDLKLSGLRLADAREAASAQRDSEPFIRSQFRLPDMPRESFWHRPVYEVVALRTEGSEVKNYSTATIPGSGQPYLVLEWVQKEHRSDQRLVARLGLADWSSLRGPDGNPLEEIAVRAALRPPDWDGQYRVKTRALELPPLPPGFQWEKWVLHEGAIRGTISKADEHIEICVAHGYDDAERPSPEAVTKMLEWLEAHLYFSFEQEEKG